MSAGLTMPFDAVVMLTLSDWRTEMRSNRYHYATRFAKRLPVIFVQPDLDERRYAYEESDVEGVVLLHLYRYYGWRQSYLLRWALREKAIHKSLLWVYNTNFVDFVAMHRPSFTVFHATEDYFSSEFGLSRSDLKAVRRVLRFSDLLVAVSEGVKASYLERGRYRGELIVVENGCDAAFWTAHPTEAPSRPASGAPVALYQGGIHRKIDFTLLQDIVCGLPDWEFWFCGLVYPETDGWHSLCQRPNVKYFGVLRPEEVRTLAHRATVGLIPFVQTDWIIERSFPLKTFEYVACGLPVVSVPIKALRRFAAVVATAETAGEFVAAMQRAASTRDDPAALVNRLHVARQHDYDLKLEALFASDAFQAADGSARKDLGWHSLRFLVVVMSFLKGVWTEFVWLVRGLAKVVIRLSAKLVAVVFHKDPERLEEDMLEFCRSRRKQGRAAKAAPEQDRCAGVAEP